MELQYGNHDRFPVGTFSYFEGHTDRSSDIFLIPSGGVLCKAKKRKPEKALRELIALRVCRAVLDHHGHGSDITVISPEGLALDTENKIYMTFSPGVTGGAALSCSYEGGLTPKQKREARLMFAKHMGRLLHIKEVEKLVHRDFLLRHVLFNLEGTSALSMIDVENAGIGDVQHEHAVMHANLVAACRQSPELKRAIEEHIEAGYYAPIDNRPVIQEVIDGVARDMKLTGIDFTAVNSSRREKRNGL